MTEEELKFEAEQMQTFFGGGNPKAGQLVKTKTGLIGIAYNKDEQIKGKTVVTTSKGKLLCDPKTLQLIGYTD